MMIVHSSSIMRHLKVSSAERCAAVNVISRPTARASNLGRQSRQVNQQSYALRRVRLAAAEQSDTLNTSETLDRSTIPDSKPDLVDNNNAPDNGDMPGSSSNLIESSNPPDNGSNLIENGNTPDNSSHHVESSNPPENSSHLADSSDTPDSSSNLSESRNTPENSSNPGDGDNNLDNNSDLVEVGKLISKVEIPAFIPRADLGEQLMRWAYSIGQEEGLANFGLPMRVQPNARGDGSPNGFKVEFVREGVTVAVFAVLFDNEVSQKHEWVGRGADGFPTLEGKVNQILGKNLMIRKIDDHPVDDQLRAAIRGFCEALVSALNKYYAFGSCFTDDTT